MNKSLTIQLNEKNKTFDFSQLTAFHTMMIMMMMNIMGGRPLHC